MNYNTEWIIAAKKAIEWAKLHDECTEKNNTLLILELFRSMMGDENLDENQYIITKLPEGTSPESP